MLLAGFELRSFRSASYLQLELSPQSLDHSWLKNLPNELILFKRDKTQDFEINHEFRDSFSYTAKLLRFPIKRALKAAVSLFFI